jgi:hypothetical protein
MSRAAEIVFDRVTKRYAGGGVAEADGSVAAVPVDLPTGCSSATALPSAGADN